jgi:ligand-binding sensor domain-containing protein
MLLFLLPAWSDAQISWVHYTVKDGLPQMQCMVLYQDTKGYIWIGTKGGISRYDGIDFVNFSINEGLPDSRVVDINEDHNGNLWVLTNNGLSLFNGRAFVYYPPEEKMFFKRRSIVFDNEDNIWIIEGNYDNRPVMFSKGKYKPLPFPQDQKKGWMFGLIFDKVNNTLFFAMNNRNNTRFYSCKNDQFQVETLENEYVSLFPENNLMVIESVEPGSPENRFTLYKLQDGNKEKIFSGKDYIDIPKQLNDSTYVFTTFNFRPNMPLCYVVNGKLQNNPLRFDHLNDILQDDEKNIWIASEKGLYRVTPFKNYTKEDNMPDYVWTIQEDPSGRIWFASYSDSHLFYLEDNTIRQYPEKFETGGFFFGAIRTKNGNILFPYYTGIMVYNNRSFCHMDLPERKVTMSLFEDTISSKLYIGNYGGLFMKDKNGHYEVNKRFIRKKDDVVLDMVMNKKGELWFVGRKSFGILNRPDTLVMHNDTVNGAMTVYCDDRNNLWIGTNNGLFLYNYKNFTRIDHPELKTMIGSIKGIDRGHFVYGGLRGIGIFDLEKFYAAYPDLSGIKDVPAGHFVDYYTRSHGFLGEEVGQVGIFKDSKGRVWVPTNNNVVMFNPKALKKNKRPPRVYITRFMTSSDNIHWQARSGDSALLKYDHSNIRIEFLGLSFTAPDMVRYKYRLKGFSDEWSNETKERYVTFTNLPPEHYTFELTACNNNNVWTKKPVTMSFEIVPAWWQTTWFRILAVISQVLTAVLIIIYFYHRRLRKKHLDDKLYNLQLRSMQSQLYPHLLFNMASATGSVIFKEDKEKAYDFVVKISKFMRHALEDTKRLYKSLEDEMNFVRSYLELQKTRFPERFNYKIMIGEQVDLSVQIPQMTVQTYVENAVKHGLEPMKEGGSLEIEIKQSNKKIVITVKDNGVGIDESKKHRENGTGNGIRIMNEIFEIHNKKNGHKITFKLIDLYRQGKRGTVSLIEIKMN